MPYPRFTKVIIDHFISKDNTIFMRNRINLHTARDDSLLGALKFVSKTKDCHKYGALIPDGLINDDIKQSQAYNTYLDYATGKVPPKKARKFKKHASPKLKTIPASPKEPTQKGKRVKRPAKKATTASSTGVVIRDTPAKSVSKKKSPAKADRGKGIELLSDAALHEDAQLKKTLRKRKRETHKLQASCSSEGADFESEVLDEQTGKTKDTSNSEDESDDVHDEDDGNDDDSGNDDDGGNDAQDSEHTDLDDDENPSFTLKVYEEEEQDDEYVHTLEMDKSDDEEKMYEEEDDDVAKELYRDLNITQGLRDTDMTNAEQGGEDQQNAYHESGPDVNEIASLMNTSTVPPPPPLFDQRVSSLQTKMSEFNQTSQFAKAISSIPSIVDQYLASKMKEAVDVAVQLQSNKLKEEAEAENQEFFNQVDSTMKAIIKEQTSYAVADSLLEFELKKILIDKMETNKLINRSNIPKNLYNALVEAYNLDKDIITAYGDAVTLKRGRDDQDKDEDPYARSDRGTKRRKSSKDAEPSKGSKSKESKSSSSSKGTRSQPKSSGKSTQAEEPEFEAAYTEMQQDQGNESGHMDDQPDNEASPKHDWF
ncbi:hypothetical protein Tco_0088918 [Tanacetum coccineum]